MKSPHHLIWTLLSFCFFTSSSICQTLEFDFSGLPLFWEVVDILEKNREPSDAEWNKLFSHPAYLQIDQQGQRKRRLLKYMPYAYMPSNKKILDSILTKTDGYANFVCSHLVEVAKNRKELSEYAEWLKESGYPEKALEAAKVYLPPGMTEQFEPPKVYLILFERNGFGGRNLVLDLFNVMNNKDEKNIGFIAHEAHHSYRGRIDKSRSPERESEYYLLYYAFSGLLEEGIACLLDKRHYPDLDLNTVSEDERSSIQTFRKAYINAPNTFKKMDENLKKIASGGPNTAELGKQIHSSLTWGGHPDGMYMAVAIEKALGRKKLIKLNGNAFAFFLAYNKAAKKLKGDHYIFSKESIKLVKSLEKQFIN